MPAKGCIYPLAQVDLNRVVATIDDIRRYNPQRHEIEQLTAVVHEDSANNICIGYKDITPNEFWVRGHMPGMPVMPGVLMCEAGAQLCSYYCGKYGLMDGKMVGFGGMEHVRFRDVVCPPSRLVIMAQLVKIRRGKMVVSRFQSFVRKSLVCEGTMMGIALPVEAMTHNQPTAR